MQHLQVVLLILAFSVILLMAVQHHNEIFSVVQSIRPIIRSFSSPSSSKNTSSKVLIKLSKKKLKYKNKSASTGGGGSSSGSVLGAISKFAQRWLLKTLGFA
jgi:hypothetical protein